MRRFPDFPISRFPGKFFPDPTGLGLTTPQTVLFSSDQNGTIQHELRSYTGKITDTGGRTGITTLTGVTTATSYTLFNGVTDNRYWGSGVIDVGDTRSLGYEGTLNSYVHPKGSACILVSTTCAPTISHWGCSVVMDGKFDDDASLLFNYSRDGFDFSDSLFKVIGIIRPAPSASSTLPGNLGERELINRSILKLIEIEASPVNQATNNVGEATMEVIGILNPSGYDAATWQNANKQSIGGLEYFQPSFAQYSTSETTVPADGELLFKFEAPSGQSTRFPLTQVKELQTGILGGNVTYPDGPDILVIIARNITASLTNRNVTFSYNIKWTEAQA